jgi:hydrogenase-4 component H
MLKTVLQNLLRGPGSLAPEQMPPRPPTLRGLIKHDAGLCTACGTCAFVCAPKAISVVSAGEARMAWRFFAGQCSFCGLCVAHCPTHALGNPGTVPPVGTDLTALRFESIIGMEPCSGCGAMHIPMPAATQETLPGGDGVDRSLCPDCRRKHSSSLIRDAFLGEANTKGEGRHGHE